jgi:hypothetical protein
MRHDLVAVCRIRAGPGWWAGPTGAPAWVNNDGHPGHAQPTRIHLDEYKRWRSVLQSDSSFWLLYAVAHIGSRRLTHFHAGEINH